MNVALFSCRTYSKLERQIISTLSQTEMHSSLLNLSPSESCFHIHKPCSSLKLEKPEPNDRLSCRNEMDVTIRLAMYVSMKGNFTVEHSREPPLPRHTARERISTSRLICRFRCSSSRTRQHIHCLLGPSTHNLQMNECSI